MADHRGSWTGRLDFVMSALSFAVGMGNLWRFPYLCYRNGGGAFLIPYVFFMIMCGYPLMLIELALGQYCGQGIVSVWKSCPLFEGIGWGMFSVSIFTGIYYNMIISWCFFYLFASFARDVPWRTCENAWNTESCLSKDMFILERNCSRHNGTWYNATCIREDDVEPELYEHISSWTNITSQIKRTSPSDEFFNNYMLGLSGGFHDLGEPRWQLVLCLLLSWILVFIFLAKGIKVSGKITYVTALLPYVVLTILLVRSLTLEGSVDGIIYYIKPDWSKLASFRIWGDAAVQSFFSLSLCWGGLISLASYNKFNNDCVRDSIIVATGDMLTSIFAGFVIFSVIGYMANHLDLDIRDVATHGPGLAFIVYPEVVTQLPVAPVWAILFMLMLLNIGIGSQMGLVSTIHTTLLDRFQPLLGRDRRPLVLLLFICVCGFLLGLTLTTRGGAYMLILMDTYSATYVLLVLALFECIALGFVYGWRKFYTDIESMIGRKLSLWWMICWLIVDPIIIISILVFVFVDFARSSYRDYVFPLHWEVLGWGIAVISMLCVPAIALIKLFTSNRHMSLAQRFRLLIRPSPEWGPAKLYYEQPASRDETTPNDRKPINDHVTSI